MTTPGIGWTLHALRVRHGLTRVQLGADLGLSQPHISNVEAGRANVTDDVLSRYATRFDLSVDDLLAIADRHEDDPATVEAELDAEITRVFGLLAVSEMGD